LLNGTKNWITNGSTASTYLVIAQTDVEKDMGYQCFMKEKVGLVLILDQKKRKIRGGDTHSLMFTVKVPKNK
jgi:alkylation response protein AidB-like acyl-CoA dehydrogenase